MNDCLSFHFASYVDVGKIYLCFHRIIIIDHGYYFCQRLQNESPDCARSGLVPGRRIQAQQVCAIDIPAHSKVDFKAYGNSLCLDT